MTVEAWDFDPGLSGHPAVILDWGGERVCHAVVSILNPDGSADRKTECGREVDVIQQDVLRREDFDAPLCGECWPESIIGSGSARRADP